MNIHQLKSFYVLAQKGSYSLTAEALYITQPAVSVHIKSLEQFFGVILVEKVAKKFVLTEAGHALYQYTEKIFKLLNETERTLKEFNLLERGSIHLGASSNIGVYMLPSILGEFKEKFPKINVDVSIGTTRIIEQKILNYEVDIGIVEAQIFSSEVFLEHWKDERLVLITSPKHPWAALKKVTPDQVKEAHFLVGESGSGTGYVLSQKLPSLAANFKEYLRLGSTEGVKRAVEENLGVSIVGESTVSREIEMGILSRVEIVKVELIKELNIVFRKEKLLTPAHKEFIKFISGK
jgi:DNA-binding transcriptional LysR family regulator